MNMIFAAWRVGTQAWSAFLVFMFMLAWPVGFFPGYPAPLFLRPTDHPWIMAVIFGLGAIPWGLILAAVVKMILYDGAGFSDKFTHKVQNLFLIGWALFCTYILLRLFFFR